MSAQQPDTETCPLRGRFQPRHGLWDRNLGCRDLGSPHSLDSRSLPVLCMQHMATRALAVLSLRQDGLELTRLRQKLPPATGPASLSAS